MLLALCIADLGGVALHMDSYAAEVVPLVR